MQPKFFYFDLGKVLIDFSAERMFRQIADVFGVGTDRIKTIFTDEDLLRQYESGRVSEQGFYETVCRATGSRPSLDALALAASDIFEPIRPMAAIVAQLQQAGYPTGILSNTCTVHWNYCVEHYQIVSNGFKVRVLSFEIGAVKPEAAIFQAAAELAGVPPEEIFFVDDLPGHIAGARAVGFDAVQFTTPAALASELRARGLRFNY